MRQFLLLFIFVFLAFIFSGTTNKTFAQPYCTNDGFSCTSSGQCCGGNCNINGVCGPEPVYPPSIQNVTINSPVVAANGVSQYQITMIATDSNGGADIADQWTLINYLGDNGAYPRGLLAYSKRDFAVWGGLGAMEPTVPCTNTTTGLIDGKAGVYNNNWGYQFVNVVAGCTTSTAGTTRSTTITVVFDPSFVIPKTGNTLSGFVYDTGYDYDGWREFPGFNLQNTPPVMGNVTIAPKPINANGVAPYVATITSSDANGGGDVGDQHVWINLYGPNGGQYRGVFAWSASDFYWWGGPNGGLMKANSIVNCNVGKAGIYYTYGESYITLVPNGCNTSVAGNVRTTTVTLTFAPSFKTNGPWLTNQLFGWVYDLSGGFDGWYGYDTFDIARPNLYVTPGSVVLRYNWGSTPNCSNGIVVPDGGSIPNGTQVELCATWGNNGTGTTESSFIADAYVNQTAQPAYNTVGYGGWSIGPFGVGGPYTGQQWGVFTAGSTGCTTNCRAALFFDRNNTIAELNETDNFATSVMYNILPSRDLTGNIFVDSSFNNCASGTTVYSGTGTVTGDSSSTAPGSGAISGGTYTASVASGNSYTATISNLPSNYTVKRVNYNGGGWTNTGLSGFIYDPVNPAMDLTTNKTLDWCLDNRQPWFMTGDGDIRRGNLINPVPAGSVASNNPLSGFFSSSSIPNFGSGSTPGFVVGNEFSYNDEPRTKQGLFSYTFFINRAKIKAVPIKVLEAQPQVSCSGNNCTITNLPTGIYHYDGGNLAITSYTHLPGTHVLILVNGDAVINNNIKLPAGASGPSGANLFALAVKRDIIVSYLLGSVGGPSCVTHNPVQAGDYACAQLEGIYSAERSFNIPSNPATSCPATPDKQLTIAGNIVTNALKPFATNGSGVFNNQRNLCDNVFPSFVILSRYDFIPQLTDFYKVPSVRWKEVNP